jgi:endogenous inhibitor of DNA gyrase (YacG/DUF329 family)
MLNSGSPAAPSSEFEHLAVNVKRMTDAPTVKMVSCPTCGRPVEWSPAQRWKPFCSERCKMIDLGAWIDERHRIPGDDATPADEDIMD